MKNVIKNLLIVLLFILLTFLFYNFIFIKYRNKQNLENSSIKISEAYQNSPFSIAKIILYSSAFGENQNTTFQKSNWILNILQYSDIAIYIDNTTEKLNASNTVKKLWLENISISSPKLGKAALYYFNSLNFGTANFNEDNKLEDSLEFTVLNDDNKNNEIQSNTPVFFTDCSNPITLKYVNSGVKENYTVTTNEPIFFNGKLLSMANIALEDLAATIQFTIHIQSNDNKNYSYDLSLPISFKNGNSTIYDGSILVENEYENAKFMIKN